MRLFNSLKRKDIERAINANITVEGNFIKVQEVKRELERLLRVQAEEKLNLLIDKEISRNMESIYDALDNFRATSWLYDLALSKYDLIPNNDSKHEELAILCRLVVNSNLVPKDQTRKFAAIILQLNELKNKFRYPVTIKDCLPTK